jgi:hypothetical protein
MAQAGQHGGWSVGAGNQHLRTSYLLNPSFESTRLLAGHPGKGGGFYVPRLLLLMERAEWRELRPKLAAALDAHEAKSSAEQVFAPKFLTWLLHSSHRMPPCADSLPDLVL